MRVHKTRRPTTIVFLTVFAVSAPLSANAQPYIPEPAIDLGESSFLDGEGGVGALLEIIGDGYGATRFKDAGGHPVPGHFQDTAGGPLLHLVYTSPLKFLGAHVGFETLLPLTYLHFEEGGLAATSAGAGDVLAGSYLEWSNLALRGRPFSMRFAMEVTAPTGDYAADRLLNLGENVWQIYPDFAWTWRISDRWEISDRTTYNWSGVNDRPPTNIQARSLQAGEQISNNISASYGLTPTLRLGIASYQLEQLNDTHLNGQRVAGLERVFGAGPGMYWTEGRLTVIANAYKEFAAQSRPEGYQGVLRLLYAF
jgi:hypothetical protein